jgi:hypothetical protein
VRRRSPPALPMIPGAQSLACPWSGFPSISRANSCCNSSRRENRREFRCAGLCGSFGTFSDHRRLLVSPCAAPPASSRPPIHLGCSDCTSVLVCVFGYDFCPSPFLCTSAKSRGQIEADKIIEKNSSLGKATETTTY